MFTNHQALFHVRKYLTSILASLQVSSTHHAVSDLSRVGAFTVRVRQNGDFHTLKVKWVEHCR